MASLQELCYAKLATSLPQECLDRLAEDYINSRERRLSLQDIPERNFIKDLYIKVLVGVLATKFVYVATSTSPIRALILMFLIVFDVILILVVILYMSRSVIIPTKDKESNRIYFLAFTK